MSDSINDFGDCVIEQTPRGLVVKRADPEILISAELLDQARCARCHPAISVTDDLLCVAGVNRRVSYRVSEFDPPHTYHGRLECDDDV